jgi:uncharacterized protein YkwD
MVSKSRGATLLATFILAQTPAFGQSVKEMRSQSFERSPVNSSTAKNSLDLARVKKEIVSSTNNFRRQEGRAELKVSQQLADAAQYFADYLARTDKYSHTADGKEPWERAAKYGYAYCIILENIAYEYSPEGFRTADLVQGFMKGWQKSPPHRKNLLDPDVSEIGVGLAHSDRTGRYYAVQNFGRPKSMAIVFKITNETDSPVKYTLDGKEFSLDPRYTITYEECRPPELRFQLSQGPDAKSPKEATIRPRDRGHYVVRKDESGALRIEQG